MDDPHEHLRADRHLGPVVDRHGPVGLDVADDPFERLLGSILRQQLSMDAAAAIRERLFEAVDPTPAAIRAADETVMREAGLSAAKVEYAKALADAWTANDWSREHFADLPDEAVVEEVTAVRGIGPWSAKMFLMFGLGRTDVFPVEDLGIRKAMWELVDADLSRAAMVQHAERWAPHRSYASRYLWRAIE
ncbi:MAG: DNA-3-methyladenine glycosylase [Halanaeroarchaeum sp.]